MIRLRMKNCNIILIEKLQKYQSIIGKIDKYEYLSGEKILPYNQKQTTEQAKFTYSPLGKAFEKQLNFKEKSNQCNKRALKTNN